MPCRICLEDDGPFINPCLCTGTIRDIHEKCLLKWIRISQNNNFQQSTCDLCHVPLIVKYNYPVETRGYIYRIDSNLLTNPAIHVFIHSLVMLTCCNNQFQTINLDRFLTFQIVYNIFFCLLWFEFIRSRVVNKVQYFYTLLTYPYIFIVLGNILLWFNLIYSLHPINISKFTITSLATQTYMGLYPIFHNHIIDKINNGRQPIIHIQNSNM